MSPNATTEQLQLRAPVSTSVASAPSSFEITAGRQVPTDPRSLLMGSLGLLRVGRTPGREPQMLELVKMLLDYDPDASKALWNLILLCNSGHTVEVRNPRGNPIPDATARLNQFASRVWREGGGGSDALITALIVIVASEGGMGIDVAPTDDLKDVEDFYPFGAADIEFRYLKDEATERPRLFMFPARRVIGQEELPLNENQVKYQPLHPSKNDPYGRPPLLPALKALTDFLGLLKEHQDVIRVHGYGQKHIKLNKAAAIASAPDHVKNDPAALTAFLEAIRGAVDTAFKTLKPTDTIISWDDIEVNTTMPGGRGANMGIEPLMGEFTRRIIAALKSLPILQGQMENGGNTQATVQWQIHVKGIKAIQQILKRILESAYNVTLRIWGIQGSAHIEFEAVRETDRMVEANADKVELDNEERKYKLGITKHETLADRTDGHAPEGPPPPTYADEFRAKQSMPINESASAGASQDDEADLADANQPGSDAGLTEEEGEALDQAGQNSVRGRRTDMGATKLGTRLASGQTVQDEDLVRDIQRWVANEALWNDPQLPLETVVDMVVEEFRERIAADAESQGIVVDDGEIIDFVWPIVEEAFEDWHEDPLMNDES